jgi:hypothetical protein
MFEKLCENVRPIQLILLKLETMFNIFAPPYIQPLVCDMVWPYVHKMTMKGTMSGRRRKYVKTVQDKGIK